MDEGLSRAVIKVFVELHPEAESIKTKRLVNWESRAAGPAISDLEVQQIESRAASVFALSARRQDLQNPDIPHLSSSAPPTGRTISAIARVAVASGRHLYARLVGTHVILPLVGTQYTTNRRRLIADPETVRCGECHARHTSRFSMSAAGIICPNHCARSEGAVSRFVGNEDILRGLARKGVCSSLEIARRRRFGRAQASWRG